MSGNYSNNPFTNLFNELEKQLIANTKNHYFATVSSVSESGISISIDGDTSGVKKYTCNRGASFSPGDRVLVAKESGTYVVICKIGKPGKLAKKTSAMTQPVGTDSDGGLWTAPAESYNLPMANSTTLGGVKPTTKTTSMTQEVGVDTAGKLWTTPPDSYNLPVATSTKLGGVKPTAKSAAMTQPVGVDSYGGLWTTPSESYSLPMATSATLGGVKPTTKTTSMTQEVGVDTAGKLWTTPPDSYNLPVATSTKLGGVKPTAKSAAMTQPVGVDGSGGLWVAPAESYSLPIATSATIGGVKPESKTTSMTQEVGVDTAGKLWTKPPGAAKVTTLYSSTTATTPDTVTLSTSGVLTPGKFSRYSRIGLGSNGYWFGDCYLGGYGATRIGNDTTYSSVGFFGKAPISPPTISAYSSNMGYTSATESNHLNVLNNVVGILQKYGLIK